MAEDCDAHLQPAITPQRFVVITCTLLYDKAYIAYNFLMLGIAQLEVLRLSEIL